MLGFIVRLVVSAVTLWLIAYFSDGAIVMDGILPAIIVAVVLGFANAFVKPVIYWIAKKVTCILTCLTLGLWTLLLSWAISAGFFFLAGKVVPGFEVKTFVAALAGSFILATVNALAGALLQTDDKD